MSISSLYVHVCFCFVFFGVWGLLFLAGKAPVFLFLSFCFCLAFFFWFFPPSFFLSSPPLYPFVRWSIL
ncbi:hypothetical protein [Blackfly microvirus SF02]|uniref:Uncharacterized protein n=1 Tax=Blackfly microvirus SF02 TaxID=2576452 RepID=A0A4P8PJS9_9VIRU|nr:hypothetical protein [Blackfly microvirus SF02]QCQ84834.1 hypothetical protein [Blackfly microvirus SF02]